MKYILIFLFIIVIVITAFAIKSSLTSPTGFVVAENKENEEEIPTFRLYTKAICNNVSGFIVCQDELFANCGGFEYKLPKNEVNGNGIFDKEWEDPRYD